MFCDECGGAGKIVTYIQVARPPFDWVDCPYEIIECPVCEGKGYGPHASSILDAEVRDYLQSDNQE